jgi:hypothetical protein
MPQLPSSPTSEGVTCRDDLCLIGALGGQQLIPMQGSPAMAGCGWMVSSTAVAATLAARMVNAKIENATTFMAASAVYKWAVSSPSSRVPPLREGNPIRP